MPKVSVVMSSYNHEAFVAEAVESVLAQDFADWELIIRDDGSDDRTAEIVGAFQERRIRHLGRGTHIGGAASLNRCIEQATGEYVAILNSDDAMLPHRLSTQVGILDRSPELGAVFSHAEIVNELGNAVHDENQFYCSVFNQPNRTRQEWLTSFFQKGNCLCHPSVLIRRSVYDEVGLYDPLMLQLPDLDLWVRLCARHEIHVHQSPLLRFRLLPNWANASADSPLARERNAYEMTKVLARFAGAPILEQLHDILPDWVASGHSQQERLLGLANAALAVTSSPHHFFALDCLREHARLGANGAAPDDGRLLSLGLSARPFSQMYGNESLSRKVKALEKNLQEAQKVIVSATKWQERSWFKRALGRWKPPGG